MDILKKDDKNNGKKPDKSIARKENDYSSEDIALLSDNSPLPDVPSKPQAMSSPKEERTEYSPEDEALLSDHSSVPDIRKREDSLGEQEENSSDTNREQKNTPEDMALLSDVSAIPDSKTDIPDLPALPEIPSSSDSEEEETKGKIAKAFEPVSLPSSVRLSDICVTEKISFASINAQLEKEDEDDNAECIEDSPSSHKTESEEEEPGEKIEAEEEPGEKTEAEEEPGEKTEAEEEPGEKTEAEEETSSQTKLPLDMELSKAENVQMDVWDTKKFKETVPPYDATCVQKKVDDISTISIPDIRPQKSAQDIAFHDISSISETVWKEHVLPKMREFMDLFSEQLPSMVNSLVAPMHENISQVDKKLENLESVKQSVEENLLRLQDYKETISKLETSYQQTLSEMKEHSKKTEELATKVSTMSSQMTESIASSISQNKQAWTELWAEEEKELQEDWESLNKITQQNDEAITKIQETMKREFDKLSQYLRNAKTQDVQQSQQTKKFEEAVRQNWEKLDQKFEKFNKLEQKIGEAVLFEEKNKQKLDKIESLEKGHLELQKILMVQNNVQVSKTTFWVVVVIGMLAYISLLGITIWATWLR